MQQIVLTVKFIKLHGSKNTNKKTDISEQRTKLITVFFEYIIFELDATRIFEWT